MPDEAKQKLVALMTKRGVPIIENAVCNELYFGESFPTTLRTFDTKGIVLQCGSFSKTLAPTLNVGWVLTGQYRAQIEKLKFLNRVTTPSVSQLAIAEFLQRDGYDHHLRRLRKIYAQQVRLMTSAIARFFPAGTHISRPAGGYMLWVELDRRIHSMELYRRALECGMTVGPGCMFSASKAYGHCIRLNFSYAWSPKVEAALAQLGQIVSTMLSDAG
jgi:DNA-binding transcriptional MocR family regulator